MREVIARSDIQPILTEGRSIIKRYSRNYSKNSRWVHKWYSNYTSTNTKADPRIKLLTHSDVQAARADMERSKNEAEAYANDVIQSTRTGTNSRAEEVVAKAEIEASRFAAIYNEYKMLNQLLKKMYLKQWKNFSRYW